MLRYMGSLAIVLSIVTAVSAQTTDIRKGTSDALVLERFAVASRGDGLLIPVAVGPKKYLFSGVRYGICDVSIFDASIPLGKARGVSAGVTPLGNEVRMSLIDPYPKLRSVACPFRVSGKVAQVGPQDSQGG